MAAGRASIIAYTMPVWAILFSTVVLRDVLTKRKVLALLIGMSGLAILILPTFARLLMDRSKTVS
jgi:drug/metabolite transporter (DMT)-like permease